MTDIVTLLVALTVYVTALRVMSRVGGGRVEPASGAAAAVARR